MMALLQEEKKKTSYWKTKYTTLYQNYLDENVNSDQSIVDFLAKRKSQNVSDPKNANSPFRDWSITNSEKQIFRLDPEIQPGSQIPGPIADQYGLKGKFTLTAHGHSQKKCTRVDSIKKYDTSHLSDQAKPKIPRDLPSNNLIMKNLTASWTGLQSTTRPSPETPNPTETLPNNPRHFSPKDPKSPDKNYNLLNNPIQSINKMYSVFEKSRVKSSSPRKNLDSHRTTDMRSLVGGQIGDQPARKNIFFGNKGFGSVLCQETPYNLYADNGENAQMIDLKKKKSGTLGVRKKSIVKYGLRNNLESGLVNSDRDTFAGSNGMKSLKSAEKGTDWSLVENKSSKDDEARRMCPKTTRAKNSKAFIKETSFETDGHFLKKVKSIMESMREKSTRKNVEMNIRPSSFLNDSTSPNNPMNPSMRQPVPMQPYNSKNPAALNRQQGSLEYTKYQNFNLTGAKRMAPRSSFSPSKTVKGAPFFYGHSNNRCKEYAGGSTQTEFFIRIEPRNPATGFSSKPQTKSCRVTSAVIDKVFSSPIQSGKSEKRECSPASHSNKQNGLILNETNLYRDSYAQERTGGDKSLWIENQYGSKYTRSFVDFAQLTTSSAKGFTFKKQGQVTCLENSISQNELLIRNGGKPEAYIEMGSKTAGNKW
jgi:hypothetical protein